MEYLIQTSPRMDELRTNRHGWQGGRYVQSKRQRLTYQETIIKAGYKSTKEVILALLHVKKMTLSELSRNLNLAGSTVHQHISELLNLNLIQQVPNPHVKRWKYYEPRRD